MTISADTLVRRQYTDRETGNKIWVELTIKDALWFEFMQELMLILRSKEK